MASTAMISSVVRPETATVEQRREMFEGLMRSTYRQAFSFACRLTNNPAEAEDLVQETYVRAYRFFHRYDDGLPFMNWLYRIMGNAHIDMVRRKGKVKTSSIDQPSLNGQTYFEIADDGPAPDRVMLDDTMSEQIQWGLKEMNPEFRQAVLLADVEGLAYEEIAEVMNTSVGTVRSRIHRGRRQLKKFLTARWPKLYGGMDNEL